MHEWSTFRQKEGCGKLAAAIARGEERISGRSLGSGWSSMWAKLVSASSKEFGDVGVQIMQQQQMMQQQGVQQKNNSNAVAQTQANNNTGAGAGAVAAAAVGGALVGGAVVEIYLIN